MTSAFTPPLEFEKFTFNPFNLVDFRKFLIDNKVIATAISFAAGTYMETVTSSFFDNIILPIINRDADNDGEKDIQKFEDITININGIKMKIGRFLIDIFKFFLILYVLFLISRLTRDVIN